MYHIAMRKNVRISDWQHQQAPMAAASTTAKMKMA